MSTGSVQGVAKAATETPLKTAGKLSGTGKTVLGIGALAAAAFAIKDSYNGRAEKIEHKLSNLHEHKSWEHWQNGLAHYSGNPWMDQQAHGIKKLLLYGPLGLRLKFEEFKTKADIMVNEVLLPNLVPIGVGIGGMYMLLGKKTINDAFKRTFNWYKGKSFVSASFKQSFKTQAGKAFTGLAGLGGRMLRWPFKSLQHFGVAAGLGAFGSFMLGRFQDSYGHRGTEEYFFDEIYNNHGGH